MLSSDFFIMFITFIIKNIFTLFIGRELFFFYRFLQHSNFICNFNDLRINWKVIIKSTFISSLIDKRWKHINIPIHHNDSIDFFLTIIFFLVYAKSVVSNAFEDLIWLCADGALEWNLTVDGLELVDCKLSIDLVGVVTI